MKRFFPDNSLCKCDHPLFFDCNLTVYRLPSTIILLALKPIQLLLVESIKLHTAHLVGFSRVPSGFRSEFLLLFMPGHCIECFPVNSEVRVSRRAKSDAVLQVIEPNVSVCMLPAKVQTPANYIRVVHQAEKQHNNK